MNVDLLNAEQPWAGVTLSHAVVPSRWEAPGGVQPGGTQGRGRSRPAGPEW